LIIEVISLLDLCANSISCEYYNNSEKWTL